MKRTVQATCFWAAMLLLTSCASTPTKVNTGPIKAHTFNFVRMVKKSDSTVADNRPEVHEMIQNAIEKNLATKGLTMVAEDGDVAVLYLIIISDGTMTETINDYFGYGDSYDLQDKAHEAFAIGKKNRTPYDAGTLVIDIIDVKSRLVLRRNYAWRPIMRDLPVEERQERIQGAVDEALKGLRISN
jgi:hypothetical protein